MASAEYLELRNQVISAASEMDSISPCQAGMAACCTIGAPISREEIGILEDAVGRGDIAQGVIEEANTNARDFQRTACVFLDDETRTCRIYPYRPLECIDFGRGAHARTTRGWEMLSASGEGSEGELHSPDVLPRLCTHCHGQVNSTISFPFRVVASSREVTLYYKKAIGNMRLDDAARELYRSLLNNNTG